MPTERHAEAVWAGLISAALGWDVWLLRRGYRTLSQATRCPAGVLAVLVTVAHFFRLLGRFDPFIFIATKLTPRRILP